MKKYIICNIKIKIKCKSKGKEYKELRKIMITIFSYNNLDRI